MDGILVIIICVSFVEISVSVSLPVLLPATFCQSTHILLAFTIAKLKSHILQPTRSLVPLSSGSSCSLVHWAITGCFKYEIISTAVLVLDAPTATSESK